MNTFISSGRFLSGLFYVSHIKKKKANSKQFISEQWPMSCCGSCQPALMKIEERHLFRPLSTCIGHAVSDSYPQVIGAISRHVLGCHRLVPPLMVHIDVFVVLTKWHGRVAVCRCVSATLAGMWASMAHFSEGLESKLFWDDPLAWLCGLTGVTLSVHSSPPEMMPTSVQLTVPPVRQCLSVGC